MWLRDNGTLVYLTDEQARELFSMKYLYIGGGPATKVFEGRTFAGAVRVPGSNAAIAIERDRNMEGPPRMQRLDLLSQDNKELATLDGYYGGLSVSPTGTKAAYFLDREVLEIRDLEKPDRVVRNARGIGSGAVERGGDGDLCETDGGEKVRRSGDVSGAATSRRFKRAGGAGEPAEPRQLLHRLAVRDLGCRADEEDFGGGVAGEEEFASVWVLGEERDQQIIRDQIFKTKEKAGRSKHRPRHKKKNRRLDGAPFVVWTNSKRLDNEDAGGASFGCSLSMRNSLLRPQTFGVDNDGGIGDGRDILGAAEDIDDVDRDRHVLRRRGYDSGRGFQIRWD